MKRTAEEKSRPPLQNRSVSRIAAFLPSKQSIFLSVIVLDDSSLIRTQSQRFRFPFFSHLASSALKSQSDELKRKGKGDKVYFATCKTAATKIDAREAESTRCRLPRSSRYRQSCSRLRHRGHISTEIKGEREQRLTIFVVGRFRSGESLKSTRSASSLRIVSGKTDLLNEQLLLRLNVENSIFDRILRDELEDLDSAPKDRVSIHAGRA